MITASMLGQPPTIRCNNSEIEFYNDDPSSDDLGLSKIFKVMYQCDGRSGRIVDPKDFILKERLDDRESFLMDGMCTSVVFYVLISF